MGPGPIAETPAYREQLPPGRQLELLEALRGGRDAPDPETTVSEGEVEGETAARGDLPTIEGPGDIPREKRRAEVERKLAQLTAFRDIAEGLGRAVPVKGEITTRTLPQDFRAEGIQDEILRMGQELGILQKAEAESGLQAEAMAGKLLAGGKPKQLKTSDLKGLEAYKNFLREGGEILKMSEKMASSLGPIDAFLDQMGETVGLAELGLTSPEVADFRRKVTNQLNRYIKEMTGAQLSKEEAKRLLKGMPRLTDAQPVFQAKMRSVLDEVTAAHDQKLELWRQAGFEVPFEEAAAETGDMITVELNGEQDTIHRTRLNQFLGDNPNARVVGGL